MPMSQDEDKYQAGDPLRPVGFPPDVIISPDTLRDNRVPPGQSRTRKWPVLHYGYVPTIPTEKWTLEVTGYVQQPLKFNWEQFQALPRIKVFSDFHCVTRWSRLGNVWEGVSIKELLKRCQPTKSVRFAIAHGYDSGWTTNIPFGELDVDDALVCDRHDGEPLTANHGGPVRLIVPRLYAWKSAKWLRKIELVPDDAPGYWERAGYHNYGDPWREERFN